jgi:hypothetical protein
MDLAHLESRGGNTMARYGKKSKDKVGKAMHERKQGTLKSGRSGKKVTSRKQAIAIGLSEARREGGKVPKKSRSTSGKRTTAKRRTTTKSSGKKRSTAKSRKAS